MALSPSVIAATFLRKLFGARAELVETMGAVEHLPHLVQLVADGKLEVVGDATFPFADLARAHELVDSGRARGKVIVTVG